MHMHVYVCVHIHIHKESQFGIVALLTLRKEAKANHLCIYVCMLQLTKVYAFFKNALVGKSVSRLILMFCPLYQGSPSPGCRHVPVCGPLENKLRKQQVSAQNFISSSGLGCTHGTIPPYLLPSLLVHRPKKVGDPFPIVYSS